MSKKKVALEVDYQVQGKTLNATVSMDEIFQEFVDQLVKKKDKIDTVNITFDTYQLTGEMQYITETVQVEDGFVKV